MIKVKNISKNNSNKNKKVKKEKVSVYDGLKKYLRIVNYLAAAQLYLKDNFLLEDKLKVEHIKNRLLGH